MAIPWKKSMYDALKNGAIKRSNLIIALYTIIPAEIAYRTYRRWQENKIKSGKVHFCRGSQIHDDILAAKKSMIANMLFVLVKRGFIIYDGDMVKLNNNEEDS